jgi:hypothetical protein
MAEVERRAEAGMREQAAELPAADVLPDSAPRHLSASEILNFSRSRYRLQELLRTTRSCAALARHAQSAGLGSVLISLLVVAGCTLADGLRSGFSSEHIWLSALSAAGAALVGWRWARLRAAQRQSDQFWHEALHQGALLPLLLDEGLLRDLEQWQRRAAPGPAALKATSRSLEDHLCTMAAVAEPLARRGGHLERLGRRHYRFLAPAAGNSYWAGLTLGASATLLLFPVLIVPFSIIAGTGFSFDLWFGTFCAVLQFLPLTAVELTRHSSSGNVALEKMLEVLLG